MRSLYGDPGPRRTTTGHIVRIVDRMMLANGARHAADMPEEARVRLYRGLSAFLQLDRDREWERRLGGRWVRFRLWLAEVRELCRQALLS